MGWLSDYFRKPAFFVGVINTTYKPEFGVRSS